MVERTRKVDNLEIERKEQEDLNGAYAAQSTTNPSNKIAKKYKV